VIFLATHEAAGCYRVFTDHASGDLDERVPLAKRTISERSDYSSTWGHLSNSPREAARV